MTVYIVVWLNCTYGFDAKNLVLSIDFIWYLSYNEVLPYHSLERCWLIRSLWVANSVASVVRAISSFF